MWNENTLNSLFWHTKPKDHSFICIFIDYFIYNTQYRVSPRGRETKRRQRKQVGMILI